MLDAVEEVVDAEEGSSLFGSFGSGSVIGGSGVDYGNRN